MKKEGYIEKITYRNEDNGYTVMHVEMDDGDIVFVGNFTEVYEGGYIIAEGEEYDHKKYGVQFQVKSYELAMPDDLVSIEKYLGSGIIKGIGPVMAKKITKKFKKDTFRIIDEEPERLAEIKGISLKKAQDVAIQFREKKELREAMVYLSKLDIKPSLAVKIYEEYGEEIYTIIKTNPYKIAEDIEGVGFRTADAIARNSGIRFDSEFRIRAAVVYALNMSTGLGNTFLPKEKLYENVGRLIEPEDAAMMNLSTEDVLPYDTFEAILGTLEVERRINIRNVGDVVAVYDVKMFRQEMDIARKLFDIAVTENIFDEVIEKNMRDIEKDEETVLDDKQADAVRIAAKYGFSIITGGPGTGKTTVIHSIIRYYERQGFSILLAAPTGRAAKRITETSGYPAQTIHRLLEFSGAVSDNDSGDRSDMHFERNESNPLEADVVIVDEASMIDTFLMHSLLRAIIPGTHLVLVGDENQLPSVGPGNVLSDILSSECFRSTRLEKIHRQDEGSDIVMNAHRINRGERFSIDNKSKDFFIVRGDSTESILSATQSLVKDRLPGYVNASPSEIQVLTPMRKGELGVENLNPVLQSLLNPQSPSKNEKIAHGTTFREGDKVMQIKNDYNLEWDVKSPKGEFVVESGTGVFNGDVGVIEKISDYIETVTVRFDDNKVVEYDYSGLDELELAYSITVHKSQGSEYPAVVLPLFSGPRVLMNRNLLYTAVTRAKSCVVIVGSERMFGMMIENADSGERFSGLDVRIVEQAKRRGMRP